MNSDQEDQGGKSVRASSLCFLLGSRHLPFGSMPPPIEAQPASSDRSISTRRSGISRILMAAAEIASAIVGNVLAELIETRQE